ncbi:MAG: tRNA pseudouridine(13) synthase TruD [Candidatus Methanomethylicia archaeon]
MMETYSGIDREIGLEYYTTNTVGLNGVLRREFSDFIVEEIINEKYITSNLEAPYILCRLSKIGMDTFEALRRISRAIGIPISSIGYAGLKDSRAATTQYITVKYTDRNLKMLSMVTDDRLKVEVIDRCYESLKPRMILGNRFRITIREIDLKPSIVREYVETTISQIESIGGVLAYFGYQRFGSSRPNTHKIGYYIVKGRWKEAVYELLVNTYPYENEEIKSIRGKIAKYLEGYGKPPEIPSKLYYEAIVLRNLRKTLNYRKAILKLPRYVLRLFINSYQAYLFNKILSQRIRNGILPNIAIQGDKILSLKTGRITRVDSEIMIGKDYVTLIDIPGYNTVLNDTDSSIIILQILKSENINILDFKQSIEAKGSLRPAIMKIRDLKYKVESENNSSTIHLSFTLDRGMYATVLLREIVKPENPVTCNLA